MLSGNIVQRPSIVEMLGNSEDHNNTGFWALHSPDKQAHTGSTVVITGLGRSGTSMLAQTLQTAGLPIGNELAIGTYEDQTLAQLLRRNQRGELLRLIKERNRCHDQWGLKLPSHLVLQARFLKLLRDPVFVVIFRDSLAIAGRRSISRGDALLHELLEIQKESHRMIKQITSSRLPALLISYEKALLSPGSLIDSLDRFLGLSLDQKQRSQCLSGIKPSPELYRREARNLADQRGRIERVTISELAGWAFSTTDQSKPMLELRINGIFIQYITPSVPRDDVQRENCLDHYCVGFLASPSQKLQPGDKVSVRFANTDIELLNSPLLVETDNLRNQP